MTLVEVVMSMALFVSAGFATVSVLDATARASATGSVRERMAASAQDAMEALRAIPYDRLGLVEGADGYVDEFEGRPTVPVTDSRVAPRERLEIGGASAILERHVTWGQVTTSAGSVTERAYKRLTVVVSWRDSGRERSTRVDSAVAPDQTAVSCPQRWIDPTTTLTAPANTYLPGVGEAPAGAHVVAVGDPRDPGPATIASGTLILIVQMTGPGAGRYEYAIATSGVHQNLLSVSGRGDGAGLLNTYGGKGRFQVVAVPTFEDVRLVPGFGPLPWDGATGGVAAVDATGDVTVEGDLDFRKTGLTESWPGDYRPSIDAVLPGAGPDGMPGGPLVMLRAGNVVASDSALVADGVGSGWGGTVVVTAERGDLAGLRAFARGVIGGRIYATSDLGQADVSGEKQGGEVDRIAAAQIWGVPLGAGCWAGVSIWASTSTPRVPGDGSSPVGYRVSVVNATGRPTALLSVQDLLPPGLSFQSMVGVKSDGGVTRLSGSDPSPGDVAPTWGTFSVPAGGILFIDFLARVESGTSGVLQDSAVASVLSAGGVSRSTYDGGFSAEDDVAVST